MLVEANVPPSVISEFTSLLKTCLEPNICQFDESIYAFPSDTGIPIGSPLGSIISEVFMTHFEDKLFKSGHPLLLMVHLWRRYVDDVICIWTGQKEHLSEFLNLLNSFFLYGNWGISD